MCDGVDNCNDFSDEKDCQTSESGNHATWHHCPFGLCSQSCTWIKSSGDYDRDHHHQSFHSHKVHITTAIDTNFTLACSCAGGYTRYSFIRDQLKEQQQEMANNSSKSGSDKARAKSMPLQQATCQANGLQAALLVSSDTGFRVVNPYKRNYQELVSIFASTESGTDKNVTGHHQPSLLLNRTLISRIETFDVLYQRGARNSSIFWSNPHLNSIFRVDITHLESFFRFGRDLKNGNGPLESQPVISEPVEVVKGSSKPKAVSVNWISGQLYWIEVNENSELAVTGSSTSVATIFMAEADGSKRKTILSGPPLEQPYDLIVDPHGYLFWSDWSHTSLKIGRSSLLGTEWRPLVSSGLEWPLGLALDYEAGRLYFSDPKLSLIECVRIDGSDRQRIYSLVTWRLKPIRLDVFEDHLYVSTFPNHQIFKLEKFGRQRGSNRSDIVPLVHGVPKLSDLVVVHEARQKANLSNPCHKWSRRLSTYVSPCPHSTFICIATSPKTYECTCPDGQRKMLSNRNESECIALPTEETTSASNKSHQSPSESPCPCLNEGKCRYLADDSLYCQCPPLYDGQLCEQFRCTNYCLHNGACYVDLSQAISLYLEPPTVKVVSESLANLTTTSTIINSSISRSQGTPRCMCAFGWSGDRCEIPMNSCTSTSHSPGQPTSVCLNGGQCSMVNNGSSHLVVACNCSGTEFTGEECQDCHQALYCRHGGHCFKSQSTGHFQCACLPGFGGSSCEQHLCHPNYCSGYGNCTVEAQSLYLKQENNGETSANESSSGSNSITFRCACIRGRSGDHCQFDDLQANPPVDCDHIECVNGGTCHQVTADRAICR